MPELSEITLIRTAAGLAALATEHQAERDRRVSSEQRFRSLFSRHPDGVFEIGLNGRVVDCNQAVEIIVGYGRNQLVGERYSKVLLPEFYDVASNALILMAGGEFHSHEIAGLNVSGQAIFVDVINLPIVVDGEVRVYSL